MGHQITLVSHADDRKHADAHGFDCVLINQLDSTTANKAAGRVGGAVVAEPKGLRDRVFSKIKQLVASCAKALKIDYLYDQLISCGNASRAYRKCSKELLSELPQRISADCYDVFIISEVHYGAATFSLSLGVPFITISTGGARFQRIDLPPYCSHRAYQRSLFAYGFNWVHYMLLAYMDRSLLAVLNKYRKSVGLLAITQLAECNSTLAHILVQPRSFDFPIRNLPAHVHYGSALIDLERHEAIEFPYHLLNGKPLIYACTGTMINMDEIYQCTAEACAPLDVQLVISLGGQARRAYLADLPGDPIVVDYAPQAKIFEQASLVITHGGMNTVLEALAGGVPLLCVPITLDQPGAAARIEYSGCGRMIRLGQLRSHLLRERIEDVLINSKYRVQAEKIQMDLVEGPYKIARIVDQVLLENS